jgi:fumarylacetoacetase
MSDLKRSWIPAANSETTDFPLNNLPYGVFSEADGDLRCGVAIGDRIIDATGLEQAGHLRADAAADVLDAPWWNDFMELGAAAWSGYRARLTEMLAEGADEATQDIITTFSVPMAKATLHMPFRVAEYTDFYAGRHHATNVGTMFRGAENALPPNWLHIPIGYNGRASSVVVSGTEIRRPWGQLKSPDHDTPIFAPSRRFDIELELGAIVGTPSQGPLTVDQADAAIFGYVLLNDWSARDIQAWEYQPLGPFQAKATATTISPWIVTAEALRPFRVATPPRDVPLLPHLADTTPMNHDIALSVSLNGEEIARTNANELYYSAAQQLAHHASAGSPMRAGDLLGSGTISGPEKGNRGSLLELSWGGKKPLETASGPRSFIEDNDTLALHGAALGQGYRIGFGPCVGKLLPAAEDPFTG